MTRGAIVSELPVRRPALSLREAEAAVTAIFEAMTEALSRGDRIELRGFGTFAVKARSPRRGRNPKTGAAVMIAGKRVPFFRTGKELRREVNGGATAAERRSA